MPKTLKEQPLTLSAADLQNTSATLVENALALHPDLSSIQLAPILDGMADQEFLAQLDRSLRTAYWLRLCRARRAAEARARRDSAWLFPRIRELALALPVKVPIGHGKTVRRDQLRFEHTNLFLQFLDAENQEAEKNDPRRSAVLALQKLWPRAQKRPRLMTLAEVDALKARPPANRKPIT